MGAIQGAQKRKSNMTKWSLIKKPHLSELEVGQRCIVQDPISLKWNKQGQIVALRNKKRSYKIKLTNEKIYTRNRKFVRPDNSTSKKKEGDEEKEVEERNMKEPLRRSKRNKTEQADNASEGGEE